MRVLVKTGGFGLYRYISKRNPAPERIFKLKRTVLNQLCIQSSVRSEVDIFKKDTVHGGLDRRTRLLHVYFKFIGLCHQTTYPHTKEEQGDSVFHASSHIKCFSVNKRFI